METINIHNTILNLSPNNKAICYVRGSCYFYLALKENNNNNNEEYLYKAIEDFDYAIGFLIEYEKIIKINEGICELHKRYGEAYSIRALSYFQLNNYEKSLEDFNNAIKYDPDSADYHYHRGYYYYYLGLKNKKCSNFELAINNFNIAIELGFNINDTYFFIGDSNISKDIDSKSDVYYKRGLSYFNMALIINDNNFYYYYNKAIEDFNKIIEINKENDLAYYYKALCYYYLKNYEESINNYDISEKYCKSFVDRLSIYDKKIGILLLLGNKENDIFSLYNDKILELFENVSNNHYEI